MAVTDAMNRHLLFLLMGFLLLGHMAPAVSSGAENGPSAGKSEVSSPGQGGAAGEVRVSSFATKEEADKFAEKISGSGFQAVTRSEVTEDGVTVYRVYVVVHGAQPAEVAPPAEGVTKEAAALEEAPVGTGRSFRDLLGGGRFYHASVAVTEMYTDNAFLSNADKKSGSSTVLSPEVWLLLPHTEEKPPELQDISTSAPGGLLMDKKSAAISRKYEAFFIYHADIPLNSSLPSENTVTHRAEGRFIYNGNRFLADVGDQFTRSYDVTSTGFASNPLDVDKYISNLFNVSGSYDTNNRFRLMLDYANFFLDYDDARNDFRNRTDNSVAGYVFYKIKPKTSLFVEYDFINISHQDDPLFDSREHNFYGGVQWDITAKSQGRVKAGYGIKDFPNSNESAHNYILQAQWKYSLSSKNNFELKAYRRTDESDYLQTLFLTSEGVGARYSHRLSSKITGSADLEYEKDSYSGSFTFGGVTRQRKDNLYQANIAFRYEFRKWLQTDIGYTFTQNDSNFGDFSYRSNTLFFRITAGI